MRVVLRAGLLVPSAIFAPVTILGMRTVAILLSDPFGKDKVDFDLEPLMKQSYDECVAQLRMHAYTPTLDALPTGSSPGTLITDPTAVSSHERVPWVAAGETTISHGARGIAALKKGTTVANLWASEAEQTRKSADLADLADAHADPSSRRRSANKRSDTTRLRSVLRISSFRVTPTK